MTVHSDAAGQHNFVVKTAQSGDIAASFFNEVLLDPDLHIDDDEKASALSILDPQDRYVIWINLNEFNGEPFLVLGDYRA